MFDIALNRLDNETQDEYFYRLCEDREEMNYTWIDIKEIMNEEFGLDYGESKYRKDWMIFQRMFNANKNRILNCSEKKLLEQKDEIFKAKKELADQRREYNKQLTYDARADNIAKKLIEVANNLSSVNYDDYVCEDRHIIKNEEALLLLSDWHYGQVSDNIWNKYNVEICKQRVLKLFERVSEILRRNPVDTLRIALLGDLINGSIHVTSRVKSEEDTCDQIMNVAEIVANFIDYLSLFVKNIYVYSTYGNHGRIIPDKKDSVHSDNFEKVIPWWLEQRLRNNNKIHIEKSEYHEFVFFNIYDKNIVCTHGDLDNFKDIGANINNIFTKKFNKAIDYTFSGDKHHQESFEQFGIDSCLVGSLCGTDEYANNKRLYSEPSQTMCYFNDEDGKVCTYNIKL